MLQTIERDRTHRVPLGRQDILQSPELRAELAAFDAPYVTWKLLLNRSVRTEEEARFLFGELKRFFLIVEAMHPLRPPMYSLRVDEAWHQFALFTRKYHEFCHHFFGRVIPHEPAYQVEKGEGGQDLSDAFRAVCRDLFGEPAPTVWGEWERVESFERIRYERLETRFRVELRGDKAELVMIEDGVTEPIIRLHRRGEAALRFVADHDIFYVRELPGIDERQKVALARALLSTWHFCLAL
jgi:hypothetical protein